MSNTATGKYKIDRATIHRASRRFSDTDLKQIFVEDETVHDSVSVRLNTIHQAAVFTIQALNLGGENQKNLLNHLAKVEKAYQGKLKAIKDNPKLDDKERLSKYKATVREYTSRLTEVVFPKALNIDPKHAAHLLSKAEEYNLLAKPRPILESRTDFGNGLTLVQTEEPQDPLSEAQLDQYIVIAQSEPGKITSYPTWYLLKHDDATDDDFNWYNKMDPEERQLLHYHLQQGKNQAGEDLRLHIKSKLATLSSKHRTIIGVANKSRHSMRLENSHGETVFNGGSRLRSAMGSSRDVLKHGEDVRMAHASHNYRHIIETDLAHMGYEASAATENVDADDVITLPFLLQTNVTPMAITVGPFTLYAKEPDYSIYQDKLKAVEKLKAEYEDKVFEKDGKKYRFEVVNTNHAMNPGRHYAVAKAQNSFGAGAARMVALAAKHPDGKDQSKPIFHTAKALNALLHRPVGLTNGGIIGFLKAIFNAALKRVPESDNHRELWLSALELRLAKDMDAGAHGSCVSGKDRKALVEMMTDAMGIFRHQNDRLPEFGNVEDTEALSKIYAKIYVSGHHQKNAGQNAAGADGIKTPYLYLPKAFQRAIEAEREVTKGNDRTLKTDNDLASLNEIEKIAKKAPRISSAQQKTFEKALEDDLGFGASDTVPKPTINELASEQGQELAAESSQTLASQKTTTPAQPATFKQTHDDEYADPDDWDTSGWEADDEAEEANENITPRNG